MTALLSCCESCNGTAGAKLSSLPKAGLIDSYRFNLCVFASGWLSVPGKPSRSAKRQANFSLPFFGSRDSSLIFTVGIPALWMISEPGEVSWIFISAPVCSLVLGLHGDLSPLWSAGLKIWCSGGKIKKKKNKTTYNNFDFCPKSKQQAVAATSMFFAQRALKPFMHARETTRSVHERLQRSILTWCGRYHWRTTRAVWSPLWNIDEKNDFYFNSPL